MRINTGIPLSCVWLPIASRFKIFLHSVMESERLIATIVVLFFWLLLLGESSRFDFSLFTFFEKKTARRCDCFPYKETDWGKKMNCCAWLHAWIICRRWSFLWTKNSRSTWRLRVIVELWNEMKRKEKEKKVLNAPSTCTSHSTTSEHNSE